MHYKGKTFLGFVLVVSYFLNPLWVSFYLRISNIKEKSKCDYLLKYEEHYILAIYACNIMWLEHKKAMWIDLPLLQMRRAKRWWTTPGDKKILQVYTNMVWETQC